MYTILGKKYLIFELFNGKDYLEDADRGGNLDPTDMALHSFKKSKIVMSLDAFDLHKTEENQFAHHEIMRNNWQLANDSDSLNKVINTMKRSFTTSTAPNFLYHQRTIAQSLVLLENTRWVKNRLAKGLKKASKNPYEMALQQTQNMLTLGQTNLVSLDDREVILKKTNLEWHHKFTNALAILVMFLIGAPLGAIIKKGGFGIPVVVAVSFFILMYILTQQGDKMAKEGKVLLQLGAWASNTILGLIGIYFMRISLNDSRLFESDFYQVTWQRVKTWIQKKRVSS
jgi:lipopolysaccharide export system permease protein